MRELDELVPTDPQQALDEAEDKLPKQARVLKYGASQRGATQVDAIEAAMKVLADHKKNLPPEKQK